MKLFCPYTKSQSYLTVGKLGWNWREDWDLIWVQREMVEFVALLFPFSSQLKTWSFHIRVVQWWQRNVQISVMHVQRCCFAYKTYIVLTLDVPIAVAVEIPICEVPIFSYEELWWWLLDSHIYCWNDTFSNRPHLNNHVLPTFNNIMVLNFFYICFIGTVCDFRLSYGRVLNRKSKIIAVNRNKSQLFKVKIYETMNACMNVRSIVDLRDEDYMWRQSWLL